MNIFMVSSEARPFIKTGGLADVVYSLSKELVKSKQKVSIILPFYKSIKYLNYDFANPILEYEVQLGWRRQNALVYQYECDGITYYFIENEYYFNRDNYYGDYDDMERFAFFTLASEELFLQLNIKPDIIHCHDWHVGMLPCLIREDKQNAQFFKKTKTVFTIHNLAFQGMLDPYFIGDFYNLDYSLYQNGKLRYKDSFSTLKAGIEYSNFLTTVSPTHRNELLTRDGSMGLDGVINNKKDCFFGILNGIDYTEFNPNKDNKIFACYDETDFFRKKQINKKRILEQFNLNNDGKPCFAVVSRLTWQKGCDLILQACNELASRGASILVIGSGESKYENEFEDLRRRYPNQVGIYIGYNDDVAHKIYAGSDYFLMPSLFEPCGLGQMIAQRYGSLPIVRNTGGLKDSVIGYDGYNLNYATGFGFDEYSKWECARTAHWAFDLYYDVPLRKKMISNAMNADNSWKKSAKQYLELYRKLNNK